MRHRMHFLPLKNRRRRKSISGAGVVVGAGALRTRRNAVFDLSDDRERTLEQLFMAICSGDTEEMEGILRSRTPSTYCDSSSSDLMNCACATGNVSSVEVLLRNGVPFRSVGGKGDAPLHTAVRRGSQDIARVLLDHGADVNVETKSERRTPLHLASASRKLDILKHLIEKEAEVDKVDIYGSTALHLAAEVGFSNGVGALIEAHADPDVFNRDGWTSMHLAAANGHLSIVEQLLAAHATVDCQNRFGRTPLHWACARGHLQVARLLLKQNASTEVRDKNEKTALDHASTADIRNLIDATSASVSNLSVIPRISCSIQYVVGDSNLRLSRASAFVDALERARWSSNLSSDSGIDCAHSDDAVFDEDRRWSLDGHPGRLYRRQRKTPIWKKPEGLRPMSAPAGSAEGNSELHFQRLQKNGTDDEKQSTSAASAGSTSTFDESVSMTELNGLWSQMEEDAPRRSHSVPFYLDKARQLGSFLSPILEDDKSSVATSLPGSDEGSLKNGGVERKRPSSASIVPHSRPRRTGAAMLGDSSSSESSTRETSRKESDSDSESDALMTSEYSSKQLTRDLEKILKRVSLAAESDEKISGPGAGVHSSQALIGAMNSGLKQLLTHLQAAHEEVEEGSYESFS